MKLNKLVLTGALALGLAGIAAAQTNCTTTNYIYVTGSTAFRGATYNAIVSCFDTNGDLLIAAYGAAIPANVPTGFVQAQTASYMNFVGTINGQCTFVKCAWSGSEAGYQDIVKCSTTTEGFMSDNYPITSGAIVSTASAPDTADHHAVDIAMADNTQANAKSSSRTPKLNNCCIAGCVPFEWIKNTQVGDGTGPADWTALSNVTDSQARTALATGTKVALFTGNPSHTNHWVYVAGRDNNSGTHVNTFLTLGLPTTYQPNQIIIISSGGVPAIRRRCLHVHRPEQRRHPCQDDGGATGYLNSALQSDPINGGTGWYAIAYIGIPDAYTAINGGALALTYNGVPYSVQNVQQGSYAYWGQEECCLANCDGTSTAAYAFWQCMCSEFNTPGVFTAPYEISCNTLQVTKPEGGDPVHN